MSNSAFNDLDNDTLLSIASGQPEANTGPGHDNDILIRIAQQEREDSIDTQSGAPAGVRAQVGAAQSQEDKLTTLRNLGYTDANQTHPTCLLYTSPSPRDGLLSRMPSSA